VAIVCSEYKEIIFVNAYKMTIVKKLIMGLDGVKPETRLTVSFKEKVMIVKGIVFILNLIDSGRGLL
jgi:hypothetical protein